MFRKPLKLLLGSSVLLILLAGISMALMLRYMEQPLPLNAERSFEVRSGSNLTKVMMSFAEQGWVAYPRLLLIYARLTDQQQILVGEYLITPNDTPKSLLAKLNSGDVVQHPISFPEGLNFQDWLQRIGQHPKLAHTITANVSSVLSLPHNNPEGWFFPDTYMFSSTDSDVDILRVAHQRMVEVLEQEWQQRQVGLPYETAYEALIMASIVEKETGVAHERQQIAGVFVRRLQKGMRLQTDPTVIYGLGDRYKGNLTRRHLREDTPYNTYTRKGLPPTPIAMPGREAIHAALNPAEGTELYFVAKGDGTHQFSDTLEQHLRAVRQYQLNRSPDYRSSPAK